MGLMRLGALVALMLAPGGVMLYATCSVLPEENAEQVDAFLGRQPEASPQVLVADWGRAAGVGRQLLPGECGMDGFFYARLFRRG